MATADKPQSTHAEIVAGLGEHLAKVEPRNNQVLIGIYIQPERRASGLYVPDKSRDEDRWQGKAGFVLKKGPTAFLDAPESGVYFHGQDVSPGDVVIIRVSDGFPIDLCGYHLRLIDDVAIRMSIGTDPSIVY
jgi:co-chaperonin GroES (HSP10)